MEELQKLSRDDVLDFYRTLIHGQSPSRKKLSCHVVSMAPDGAGNAASEEPTTEASKKTLIEDFTEFKARQPLFALARPFVSLDSLRREQK